ncbi:MAG: transporter [Vicinamibacterales bacterium]
MTTRVSLVPPRSIRRPVRLAFVLAGVLLAGAAHAQGVPAAPNTPNSPTAPSSTRWEGPLAGMLPAFFTDMAYNAPGDGDHTLHFVRGLQTTIAGLELTQALAAQATAFPIVMPAGTFGFEGARATGTGVAALSARSPIVAERGTTLGRGRFAGGVSFHRSKADAISGLDLDSGELVLYAPHNNCCGTGANAAQAGDGSPAFERDVLQETLGIELRQSITAFSMTYGLTSRLDVSAVVPLVRVDLDTRITARIIRIGTTAPPTPTVHSFDGVDLANRTISRRGTATGIGDVRVRGKFNLRRTSSSAFALSVDAALPTGDADNLLGTGGTRVRAGLVASGDRGAVSPFFNAGYTRSQGSSSAQASTWQGALDPAVSARVSRTLSDEVDYAGGASIDAAPCMTFDAEVLGRTLLKGSRFSVGDGIGADGLVADGRGMVHRVLGMAGVRMRAGTRMLFTAGVILPIADKGLRSKARPLVSLDYAF